METVFVYKPTKLDRFTEAYIECLLWAETDQSNEQGGEPLDRHYSLDDFAPETLEKIIKDCQKFQIDNSALLEGIDYEQAGHDFWLTRNRHGAGFWDRGLGEQGEKLTQACHKLGEIQPYVGDDGKLYLA